MDMTKRCYCCKEDKPLDAYSKDKYRKDGLNNGCRLCRSTQTKAYHAANPEKSRATLYAWREKNREYWLESQKHRHGRSTTFKPKERVETRTRKEAVEHNRRRKSQYDKEHAAENAAYRQANKPRFNEYIRSYRKERMAQDPAYRITCVLRSRVGALIRGRNKSASTLKLLDCTIDFFIGWLERNWEQGMSRANYGHGMDKWNIDHNLPCASFDMELPEHQRICFHWSNQFPMWQRHNMAKSDSHWIADYVI